MYVEKETKDLGRDRPRADIGICPFGHGTP